MVCSKTCLIFDKHVTGTVSQSVSGFVNLHAITMSVYRNLRMCLDCKSVALIMACWIFLISAAQQTLGDCVPVEPNPLLMGGQSILNSDWNNGVGPCLRAGSNTSVQGKSNVCI